MSLNRRELAKLAALTAATATLPACTRQHTTVPAQPTAPPTCS